MGVKPTLLGIPGWLATKTGGGCRVGGDQIDWGKFDLPRPYSGAYLEFIPYHDTRDIRVEHVTHVTWPTVGIDVGLQWDGQ
jgi:hypothetical protein